MTLRTTTLVASALLATFIAGTTLPDVATSQDKPALPSLPERPKYEYQVLGEEFVEQLGLKELAEQEGDPDKKKALLWSRVEQALNKKGQEGWELVSYGVGMTIFKREVR